MTEVTSSSGPCTSNYDQWHRSAFAFVQWDWPLVACIVEKEPLGQECILLTFRWSFHFHQLGLRDSHIFLRTKLAKDMYDMRSTSLVEGQF